MLTLFLLAISIEGKADESVEVPRFNNSDTAAEGAASGVATGTQGQQSGSGESNTNPSQPQAQPKPPPVTPEFKGRSGAEAAAAGSSLDALKADPMDISKRTAYQSHANSLSQINHTLNKAAKEQKWDLKDVRKTQQMMARLSQGSGIAPTSPKSAGGEESGSAAPNKSSNTYKSPAATTEGSVEPVTNTEAALPATSSTPTLAAQTIPEAPKSATQIALAQVQNNPMLEELLQTTIDRPADAAANTSAESNGELKTARTSSEAQPQPAKELSATEKFQNFLAELFMPEFIDALSRASVATEVAPDSTASKEALPNPGEDTSKKGANAAIAAKASSAGTSSSTPWSLFTRKSKDIILGSAEQLSQNLGRGVDRFAIVLGLAAKISPEKTRRGIASTETPPTDSEARSDFSTSPSSHAAVDLAVAGFGLGGSVGFILLGLRRLLRSSRHGKRAKKRSKK